MPATDTARKPALSVHEAEDIVLAQARRAPVERRELAECPGFVLREPVAADRDFPPFDRVTMDGIAFSFAAYSTGTRCFRVQGVQAAGAPRQTLTDPTACIEVMTGAVLPGGCDCVVPVEVIRREEDTATVDDEVKVEANQYIHPRASDHTAGELLLEEGTLLRSPEIAVCATVGMSQVAVSSPLRVAVLTTGDELVPVNARPEDHQIRGSNGYAIAAAVAKAGRAVVEVFHAPDDRSALHATVRRLLSDFDLLSLSGGVSAGKFDLVPAVLEDLGVKMLFHRVAQRPGFPLWFGTTSSGKAVFGLPGNPVSSLVSTHRYIIPYIDRCLGLERPRLDYARLTERYEFRPELTLFLPVGLFLDEQKRLSARPMPVNSSGDLAGLLMSGGFLELPAAQTSFEAGSLWPLYRWQ